MNTGIQYARLAGLSEQDKRKALAVALQFTLQKTALALDALGGTLPRSMDLEASTKAGAPVYRRHEISLDALKATLARKYATEDQNPILTTAATAVQEWYHSGMPELDLGYLPLFSLVDLRGSTSSSFEINDTSAGLVWTQRQPGAATQIRRNVSESQTVVNCIEYSEGIGILDRWLQFNQFWQIDDVVAEFLAKEADKRASVHYGLLTALGSGVNTAFATDDTTTFNTAAATILRAVRSSGYAVGANAQFDIVCAPEKVGRILAMLDARRGSPMIAFGTQDQPIAFQVRNVISTTHVTAADTGYYLVLPGRKLKRGIWKDVTLESSRDIYASATDWVGVTQYNAVIGDSAQVRRVLYS